LWNSRIARPRLPMTKCVPSIPRAWGHSMPSILLSPSVAQKEVQHANYNAIHRGCGFTPL
jgi:hypothetical protein